MKHIVSFSGGKDSTAMLLRLVGEGRPLDEIVFFDTGWEFPSMIEHVDKVEAYINRPITRLHPQIPFVERMIHRPVVGRFGINKGKVHRTGYGWPSLMRRWCTREKVTTMHKYTKNALHYVGIAADEIHRIKPDTRLIYPLIEWGMSEHDCLQYCYDRGFDWSGLYQLFNRVSCYCCPLQRIGELRKLRKHFPELWRQMLAWDTEMAPNRQGERGFKEFTSLHDLEKRFAQDDLQTVMELGL